MIRPTVLVPLDGSHSDTQTIDQVARLLSAQDPRFVLARVVGPEEIREKLALLNFIETGNGADEGLSSLERTTTEAMQQAGMNMADTCKALGRQGFACRTVIELGDPIRSIVGMAEREEVDLIALSNNLHAEQASTQSIASVPRHVVALAQQSVLVLRTTHDKSEDDDRSLHWQPFQEKQPWNL